MTPKTPPDAPLAAEDRTPDPITPGVELPPLSEVVRTRYFAKAGSNSFVLLQYEDTAEVNQALDPFIRDAIDLGWTVSRPGVDGEFS